AEDISLRSPRFSNKMKTLTEGRGARILASGRFGGRNRVRLRSERKVPERRRALPAAIPRSPTMRLVWSQPSSAQERSRGPMPGGGGLHLSGRPSHGTPGRAPEPLPGRGREPLHDRRRAVSGRGGPICFSESPPLGPLADASSYTGIE